MTRDDEQVMNDDVLEQALEWYVLLQDIDASDADRQQARAWREQSVEHEAAWQRAEQVWLRLNPLADVLAKQPPTNLQPVRSRRRLWPALATAAVLVLAVLAVQLYDPAWQADYRTAVAQQQRWQLEDGSWLELAADSAVDVNYSAERRNIRLLRGKAWFQVAADAGRPFVVEHAGGTTRALGTAFSVQRRGEQTRVVVSEHSVQVSQAGSQQVLQQGQALQYDRHGISQPLSINLDNELAWRQQRLVFQRAPLAEVLGELQHYLPSRLYLTDSKLGQLPVTVVLDTRQPEKALQGLGEILPIQLSGIGPWLTLIRPVDKQ